MRILVACEFSGTVRDAFSRRGHDAWSCDLLPSETPGKHYQGDVFDIIENGWDLLIAHPPCTHLCVSGSQWFYLKKQEQKEALKFVLDLMNAPIARIAIENPVSILSKKIKKPTQIIQPWWFGDPFVKTTCLWLKQLPKLKKTNVVDVPKENKEYIHNMPRTKYRWKKRAKTFHGIAEAMADQWGILPLDSFHRKEFFPNLPSNLVGVSHD